MSNEKRRDPVKQSLSPKTFSFGTSLSQSVETVLNPRSKLHGCTETDPIIRFNATIDSQATIYYLYCNLHCAICQGLKEVQDSDTVTITALLYALAMIKVSAVVKRR